MSGWTYRIRKKDGVYGIVEYHETSLGNLWIEENMAPQGESVVELLADIDRMRLAFKYPVIDDDGKNIEDAVCAESSEGGGAVEPDHGEGMGPEDCYGPA